MGGGQVTLTPGQIKLLVKGCAWFALIVILVLAGYRCARKQNTTAVLKAEVKAQTAAAKQTADSVKISTDTQKRVETESEDTRQRTRRAVEAVDARIQAEPASPGPADPDLLRIAREAHQRALCAHSRVQRTSGCPDAASTP